MIPRYFYFLATPCYAGGGVAQECQTPKRLQTTVYSLI